MAQFPVRWASPTAARLRLRELMSAPEVVALPGPFDATSAILMARIGFEGFWAGGYLGSATSLGVGDLALTTMTEQLRFCSSIVDATGLPVVADCDDGYGGVLQVARTVQAFERMGVAAMVFEDQAAPKHCAFYDEFPLRLVEKHEMVAKIKTALDMRFDSATMIWARSDALAAGLGVSETLDRAHTYAEAGADAIFVPSSNLADLKAYASGWNRPEPLVMSAVNFGDLTLDEVKAMGFSARLDPAAVMLAALQAVEDVMGEYHRTGSLANAARRSKTSKQLAELLGIDAAVAIEGRYLPGASVAATSADQPSRAQQPVAG
jgi:2-methylisocitrate lyase-like PEP mutase family enzyme